jgi:transcriptional regulator with XRE-family HTH domain
MLQKNITLTALAKEVGVSVTYVSEIFKGTREGKKYRDKIASLLGIEEKVTA